jgi:two-component system, chemotaxis family, protein-glutamate methylesterase/glutaminase
VIRVLVAEDSPTARQLLVAILEADPEIRVVGQAVDGVEAVALTRQLHPDLVTMDVHMPRLDGLAATQEIMIVAPTPIVVVTGSTRAREVRDSMEAIHAGALEVLVKPPDPAAPRFAAEARRLVETVKAMARVKVVRHWRPAAARTMPAGASVRARSSRGSRIVVIAASTGGPAALETILCGLGVGFPLPVLVAQHITPGFTVGLAAWLDSVCPFKVKVAQQGEPLAAGTVYLAPDDRHLGVHGANVTLSDAEPDAGFRPSGTALFASAAGEFGAATLAVILTGMGEDGVDGLRAVRHFGGRVIAQDEATSVVYGMPGAAVAAGLADVVLPLDKIAPQLLKWI